MSGAALALALALLAAPPGVRPRVVAIGLLPPPGSRRPVVLCSAVVLAGALIVIAPVGAVVAAAVVAGTLARRRRHRTRAELRSRESTALQAALDVLEGELRVGAHPVVAIVAAAQEADDVVAASLREVAARARLGADVPSGLRSAARGSQLPLCWERLAVCWQFAETHGLAVAAMVHAAQQDIVERQRYSDRMAAGMAGARTTAAILAGLPLLGIGLGQLIGARPVRFLLSGGAGGWLLVIGVGLACVGLVWSDRITGRLAG